ncbi:hypothetical protein HS088_TW13G00032 [Tripterygium wilfordii]|uniref:SANTA domain-containing protein n=1 Tax=Tripterygium wilfordii TaxID=458696 RepID=A0A7J7CSY8_TRIWF|nr:hypothetical protein HS088_TW13G00032 [Tripterygium wilfordii]
MIQGFMNKLRTVENGFPSEVFSHFSFGFPTYWEEYAKKYLREESSKGIGFGNISTAEKVTTKPGCGIHCHCDSKFSDVNLEGTEQLTAPENRSKDKEKEDGRNATELKWSRKNAPLPKGPDGVILGINDNLCGVNDSNISDVFLGVIHESRSRSPAVGNRKIPEFSGNHIDTTMSVPMMQLRNSWKQREEPCIQMLHEG